MAVHENLRAVMRDRTFLSFILIPGLLFLAQIACGFASESAPATLQPTVLPSPISLTVIPPTPLPSETPIPATQTPTSTTSPSPTLSTTPTQSPTPTNSPTPTITPTYAILRGEVIPEHVNCRYGPGAVYMYKYGLVGGSNLEIIGRTDFGDWILVQAIGGNNPCWMKADLMDIQGEALTVAPVDVHVILP